MPLPISVVLSLSLHLFLKYLIRFYSPILYVKAQWHYFVWNVLDKKNLIDILVVHAFSFPTFSLPLQQFVRFSSGAKNSVEFPFNTQRPMRRAGLKTPSTYAWTTPVSPTQLVLPNSSISQLTVITWTVKCSQQNKVLIHSE